MSMINPEYQPGLFSQNEQGSVDVLGVNSITDAIQEMNNSFVNGRQISVRLNKY